MDTEILTKQIEDSFPFVPKPKGEGLSFHKDDCFHCGYLRGDLEDYNDPELPPEGIRLIHQEMSCLSAKGWRWALPSYLRYCLTDEAAYNEMEIEFLIYNFAPIEEHKKETKERLGELNTQQIDCLINFIDWCNSQDKWASYCPAEIAGAKEFLNSLKKA
ncbi:MAG: hypothetical protein GY820_13345 [Gammaproteobacteria bacterium]|nr:hypothetical protein [Gammaproteobacteria bacterium]